MGPFELLDKSLAGRQKQLQEEKENGVKMIGFSGLGYVPEEIIYGAGACPIRLVRGGDPEPIAAAAGYMDRILCPFSRAQFGYHILEEETRYQMPDCFICAITCQHMRRVADAFDIYTEIPVFRFGVPHGYRSDHGLKYYHDMVKELTAYLEQLLGIKIQEQGLKDSIIIYNRLREMLHKIGMLRKNKPALISGKVFFKLMHSSFYLDPKDMVDLLEQIYSFLTTAKKDALPKGPRILLTGNMLAVGDYKIIDLIEQNGASIVTEQFCGGVRHYDSNITPNGDLIHNIAKRYFCDRAPGAFMRPAKQRLDLIYRLAREYQVDGIIWYQLRYCETYNMEFFYFNKMMKESGLPLLQLESEYDVEERGTLLNRIEGFMESLEGRA